MTVAEELAARIRAFGSDGPNEPALAMARRCIADTIGVALAGSREECVRLLLATPGVAEAPGKSLVIGTCRRTSALDAALANGMAAHALDYDDLSGVMGGHHSAPLVPALFAVAEERRLSGIDLLTAYVAGVEIVVRLARAVNPVHYDKGWHPTATLGTIAAAGASAQLLGLDQDRMATALAIAASMAAGLKANFGTMTKPLHIGQCGRNGLLAALLAERGYTANPAAFEHRQGLFEVFNGAGTYDPARIFDGWGEPPEILGGAIALKQFPCCASTHPAIAMALALRVDEGVRAGEIERVEILPHGRRLRHTDNPHPRTPLEARFSVQYAVARALLDGAVRLAHFEGAAHAEPAILRLLEMTHTRPHPAMADNAPRQWGAEVIVTMRDGRRLSRRVDELVGRGAENPMSEGELWEKFADCAGPSLPSGQAEMLFGRLIALDRERDMAAVTPLMESPRSAGSG